MCDVTAPRTTKPDSTALTSEPERPSRCTMSTHRYIYAHVSVLRKSSDKNANCEANRYVFTARRYASVVYAVVVCLAVGPSVLHTPILYQNG